MDFSFNRFPLLAQTPHAHAWLTIQRNLGLAPNTIAAYGWALEDYLGFCACCQVEVSTASREHIAAYVRDLALRPKQRNTSTSVSHPHTGYANATLQLRLTAVRLFHDYLIEEGIRSHNPVGRGRYTPGKSIPGTGERGLIPRYRRLPWIPSDEEWSAILAAARAEPLRNRVMLAMAYGSALRREELCSLRTQDVDPARRLLRIRSETTKNRQERVVPYSAAIGTLYAAYLEHRRSLSRERGPLFLSESHRNRAAAVSIWTWSKVVQSIAERSCVRQLTTHTFRHLCLTDLARTGWDVHEIAAFAGHRSPQTTLLYIHLSGRELAAKLENGMAKIHAWRVAMTAEVLR